MLQINIGRDEKKHGFLPEEIKKIEIKKYKNINVIGVMTIAPQNKTKAELRKFFKETKKLQKNLKKTITTCNSISMGMSGDYIEAIAEGATHIRIGTGLFGKRK